MEGWVGPDQSTSEGLNECIRRITAVPSVAHYIVPRKDCITDGIGDYWPASYVLLPPKKPRVRKSENNEHYRTLRTEVFNQSIRRTHRAQS